MGARKGQFIVNYLRFELKIPETNIGRYLFKLSDEEFEEIEHEYRKYAIKQIHDPKEWKGELQPLGKMLYDDYRKREGKKPKPYRKSAS